VSLGVKITKRREKLGLTKSDLAKKASLSPTIIGFYESGERVPTYESLLKLCRALKVKPSFFSLHGTESDSDPIINVIIRGLRSFDEERKKKLYEYYCMLAESSHVSFDLPIYGEIEDFIEVLLNNLNIDGPPFNPFKIAEELNAYIIPTDKAIEYEAILTKGEKNIIIHKIMDNSQRLNFTIAHVIAHIILPWHIGSKFTCRRDHTSSFHEENILENEAHEFAASLLMPEIFLRKDITQYISTNNKILTFNAIDQLAERYNVSRVAMATRCVKLSNGTMAFIRIRNGNLDSAIINPDFEYTLISGALRDKSIAYNLYNLKKAASEFGAVPISSWSDDDISGYIMEESLYNPEYPEEVITILHKLQ